MVSVKLILNKDVFRFLFFTGAELIKMFSSPRNRTLDIRTLL